MEDYKLRHLRASHTLGYTGGKEFFFSKFILGCSKDLKDRCETDIEKRHQEFVDILHRNGFQ
jgi:hypothetical protein